ncbi:MAG: hypothetical protein ACUVRM_01320 [Bacillota bacterium]
MPANEPEYASLQELLAELQSERRPVLPGLIPLTTPAVSGKAFVGAKNEGGIERISLDFTRPDEALMEIVILGTPHSIPIGLHGRSIKDESHDLYQDTVFFTGYWENEDTFAVIGEEKGEKVALRLTFKDDGLFLRLEQKGMLLFMDLKAEEKRCPG